MSVLVTGGTGYIGSHISVTLLKHGFDVVILDNLSNSSINTISRIEELSGRKLSFVRGDIRNNKDLSDVFNKHSIEHVIHLAGLKSVSESLKIPMDYYDVNLNGTLVLLKEIQKHEIKNIIFSSSATVYGKPESVPLTEKSPVGGTTNPYGTSKLLAEKLLEDFASVNKHTNVTLLRYFNPVGAHPTGLIGEKPNGVPNNLVPYLSMVASGKLECLSVFGSDYQTLDGTGVRDYIHVMDLAEGHLAAIINTNNRSNFKVYNLGTGRGYSVLELIKTFERVNGVKVNYALTNRRIGDVDECWSDPLLAFKELNWKATRDLDTMLRDAWNWENCNNVRSQQKI